MNVWKTNEVTDKLITLYKDYMNIHKFFLICQFINNENLIDKEMIEMKT